MSHHALALALSLALCTHILIYALLGLWPAPKPENIKKSIPVTLITQGANSSSTSSFDSTSAHKAEKQEIVTTAESEIKRTEPSTTDISSTQVGQAIPTSSTEMPSRQKLQQSNRSSTSSIGSLFQSKTGEVKQEVVVSSKAAEEMSDYEQSLLKHLLASKLYDQFNRFMLNSATKEIDFQLELFLFANGAIRSAKILDKSADLDINQLVVTAAYNASPYPRPPEEDFDLGFKYVVNMSYIKDHFEINQ